MVELHMVRKGETRIIGTYNVCQPTTTDRQQRKLWDKTNVGDEC
jgi:hypothetical protein